MSPVAVFALGIWHACTPPIYPPVVLPDNPYTTSPTLSVPSPINPACFFSTAKAK